MILRAVASALPALRYDSAVVAAWCGSDEDFLRAKVGIDSRCFLDAHENEMDLAASACEKLFCQARDLVRESIGLCLYVGQVRSRTIPHASALLQQRLGLPRSCACFDVGLACSGYIYALAIAKACMASLNIGHALVITCDPYSRILRRSDRATAPLFGDAASASWLALDGPGLKIGQTDLGTDGSGAGYLEYPHAREDTLHMDGKGIFDFAVRRVPESVRRCLDLNAKTQEDIDYFFFHQANAFMVRALGTAMRIAEAKCPVRMHDVANTVSSSIPLLLEEFFPGFHHGQRVVMSAFGGGLSWGTTYAQYTGENHD